MEFELFGIKLRLEVVIACVLLGYLIGGMLLCSCSKVGIKEGFALMSAAPLSGVRDDSKDGWIQKSKEYQEQMGYKAGNLYAGLAGNKGGSVPLPDGQMDFFYDNEFKPSCCTTTNYSGSSGCPCISPEQMQYLNSRAGNRSLSGGSVF